MTTIKKPVATAATPVRPPRSDAFAAIHSAAAGLHSVGAISQSTMRDFDEKCLAPLNIGAAEVQRIRKVQGVSQHVLARFLGTNKSTVQKWESGENTPSPMAQRLLYVVDKCGLDVLK